MIYTVCEYIATGIESIILCVFLITSLQYKPMSKIKKIVGTIGFIILIIANAFLWDNVNILFSFEHLFSVSYILLLCIFSRVMLKGKWWNQAILSLVSIITVFLINILILSCSSAILENSYSEILLMRNPARIFLLFLSKLSLAALLMTMSKIITQNNYSLHIGQSVSAITVFLLSIIIGAIIEKMLLDDALTRTYATVIILCLSLIIVLFIYIAAEISKKNISEQNRIAMETRLHDDERKLKEMLEWNDSIRSLRHDMNNHLLIIKQYADDKDYLSLLQYIEKMQKNIDKTIDITATNNPALDAILNVKKTVCKKSGIDLKCYLQTDLPAIDDYFFSIVFGNLIDNAIEAELKEDIKEIRLSVTGDENNIRLTIQNRVAMKVLNSNNLPETTKSDKQHHGIGLKNVLGEIEKVNGIFDFYEENGWVIADVEIPYRVN